MSYQSDVGLIAIVIGENSKAHEALKRICVQHEALMAAVEQNQALLQKLWERLGADFAGKRCIDEGLKANVAALRAAGIQIEGE